MIIGITLKNGKINDIYGLIDYAEKFEWEGFLLDKFVMDNERNISAIFLDIHPVWEYIELIHSNGEFKINFGEMTDKLKVICKEISFTGDSYSENYSVLRYFRDIENGITIYAVLESGTAYSAKKEKSPGYSYNGTIIFYMRNTSNKDIFIEYEGNLFGALRLEDVNNETILELKDRAESTSSYELAPGEELENKMNWSVTLDKKGCFNLVPFTVPLQINGKTEIYFLTGINVKFL